ncbi:AhpC-TSA-domain-containing protein [Calocera cornea HHB12733]|uniref:thioredoxin-dependent peroxiredoxin n=1 Tax=Calocera cornea HHB12733 TaxID=1353952 RepID=A0A165EW47_9BASI|nr:AhpC-TSA-domain-containing protein [Calocera cornea HHB12733]
MAPRAKKDSQPEPTRRSTRLADKPAPPAAAAVPKAKPAAPAKEKKAPAPVKEKEEKEGKKRAAAEETKEEPAAKKPKSAAEKKPASKAKPASKKAAAAAAAKEEEPVEDGVAAEAEAAAEAPKEAPKEAPAPTSDAELELGDTLPALVLKNQKEEDVAVESLITADKGLVFFLVPKANTSGCTRQACGFRDAYPSYTGLGYEVYCLSGDAPSAQAKWQTAVRPLPPAPIPPPTNPAPPVPSPGTQQKLPYPLLSDPSHKLIKLLGASSPGNKTKRSHFVFEKGSGKLILKTLAVKPDESPKQVLAFLEGRK